MLDKLLQTNLNSTTLSTGTVLTVLLSTLTMGFIIATIYNFTHRYRIKTEAMFLTLIMVPSIISVIIMLIGTNIASAFSLSGAFALIRFRSAPGNPRDISYVFLSVAIGLSSGLGYVNYAILVTLVLSIILLGHHFYELSHRSQLGIMTLKITLPENISYQDRFEETFNKYTKIAQFYAIKTTEYGSLYEVSYTIMLKPNTNQKDFIDELRTLNSNLSVLLTTKQSVE